MDLDQIHDAEAPIGGEQTGPVEISIEEDALNTINQVIVNDRDDMQWEEEEAQKETEAEAEPAPVKKKNKVSFEKRFKQVYSEKKQMEEMLQQQYEENQRLQQMIQEKSITSVLLAEDGLDQRIERVKNLLKTAIDNSDTELQVEAYAEFSRLQGEKNDINAYKAANGITSDRQKPQAPRADQYYEEQRYNDYNQRQQEPAITNELVEWLDENPAIDPRSDEFDPEMNEEVRLYALKLERQYKREGKSAQIGKQRYFEELNAYIADNFEGSSDSYATEAPQMKRPNTAVAPPRHSSTPLSAGKSPTRINLTPDEIDIAMNMNFQHPGGRPYSREEACRAYAVQKIKMMKQ